MVRGASRTIVQWQATRPQRSGGAIFRPRLADAAATAVWGEVSLSPEGPCHLLTFVCSPPLFQVPVGRTAAAGD